jgi:hypothetical protein
LPPPVRPTGPAPLPITTDKAPPLPGVANPPKHQE